MVNSVDIFGLIGYPLGHSFSPEIHREIYRVNNINAVYTLFEVPEGELENAVRGIRALGIKGVNVTIPYKEKIIKYLDALSEEATRIGAVNTIKNEGGILRGYNTDYFGFKESLEKNSIDASSRDVFIIGSGGASKPVILCLLDLGCRVHLFARDEDKMMNLKSSFSPYGHIDINYLNDINVNIKKTKPFMIVNCTSVGMKGFGGRLPIDGSIVKGNAEVFYDLIYNPPETDFLNLGKESGCRTVSGMDMLKLQAVESVRIWSGKRDIIF